jgi:ABC-2 type transport system permease protein
MLWYKAWLETRWRFLIGMAVLIFSATGVALGYPKVVKLLSLSPTVDVGGELGRRIKESIELSREYHGYIWSQWFRQNLSQTWTVFAALLGSGGLLGHGSGGAALFTLSLPVSRARLVGVRAATGLAELLALAVIPSLFIPILSPAIGESYGVGTTIVLSVCLFAGGAVFFSLAVFLSTMFADIWRPMLIALAVAVLLALCDPFVRPVLPLTLFRVMSGEDYFRAGSVPWVGLALTGGACAALLYGAVVSFASRDF